MLRALIYYATLPFIYIISWLPWRFMYFLSDALFLFLYHVIGYRIRVVRQNLQNAYPAKSQGEIKTIERKFYRYFCDLIMESLKTLTISPESAKKRITFENPELLEKYFFRRSEHSLGNGPSWQLGARRGRI